MSWRKGSCIEALVLPAPPLAHAGAGASWQAMLVVASLGLAVAVVLAVLERLPVASPGDLVLPLAVVAVVASLAPVAGALLSDWIGWALPIGAVALLALLLGALTPLRLGPDGVLPYVAAGLAVAGVIGLSGPLSQALHPRAEVLPDPGEADLTIRSPADGDTVAAGEQPVTVTVTGASVADRRSEEVPDPATAAGVLAVTVDGAPVEADLAGECTPASPCERAELTVPLPAGEEVGLRVELLRADGTPFAPAVADRVELTVE